MLTSIVVTLLSVGVIAGGAFAYAHGQTKKISRRHAAFDARIARMRELCAALEE